MTFTERFKNAILFFQTINPSLPGQIDGTLLSDYGHRPSDMGKMVFELPRESVLSILNVDPILGYAIPSMPRTIFAGGLSTDEAKPLPSDIGGVISKAGRDVILVSFGSMIIFLPDRIINTLTEVFCAFGIHHHLAMER